MRVEAYLTDFFIDVHKSKFLKMAPEIKIFKLIDLIETLYLYVTKSLITNQKVIIHKQ